jgi:hypothetical protein
MGIVRAWRRYGQVVVMKIVSRECNPALIYPADQVLSPLTSVWGLVGRRRGALPANWRQPWPAGGVVSHENIDCPLLSRFSF